MRSIYNIIDRIVNNLQQEANDETARETQKTKERILAAALEEFGRKSYDAASVNSICEAGQIPKGLIYHNFKGKMSCIYNA